MSIGKVNPFLTNAYKVKENKDVVSTTANVRDKDQHDQELIEQIKKALNDNNLDKPTDEIIKQLAGQLDPAALKQLLDQLSPEDLKALLSHLDNDSLNQLLSKLNPEELKAVLSNLDDASLKQLLSKLSPDELKAVLSNLDEASLKQLLSKLNPEELEAVLNNLDDASLKQLLDKLSPNQLKSLLGKLDSTSLKQLLAKLSPEKLRAILTSDKAQIKTALGQMKYKELRAKLGHLPPGEIRDAFGKMLNKMDNTQLLDLLTNSEELLGQYADQTNVDGENLQQLMNNIKDSSPPEHQEMIDQLMSCKTEDEVIEFAKNNVFMGAPDTPTVGAGSLATSNGSLVGDGYNPLTTQIDNMYDSLISDHNNDKNVLKTVMILLLQYSLVQRDSLGIMAKQISGIKDKAKDLNGWWDAIQSINSPQPKVDWSKVPYSKDISSNPTAFFSNPPSMEEIVAGFKSLADNPKRNDDEEAAYNALKGINDKIKTDLGIDLSKTAYTDLTAVQGLITNINNYLGQLQKDLNCTTPTKITSSPAKQSDGTIISGKFVTSWGDISSNFQKNSAEASTIQQEATTMLQSKSTDMQTAQNLITKWLETTQAIMQKASS